MGKTMGRKGSKAPDFVHYLLHGYTKQRNALCKELFFAWSSLLFLCTRPSCRLLGQESWFRVEGPGSGSGTGRRAEAKEDGGGRIEGKGGRQHTAEALLSQGLISVH